MGTMEEREYPRVFSPLTKGPITQFVLEGKQALKSPEVPDNVSVDNLYKILFFVIL